MAEVNREALNKKLAEWAGFKIDYCGVDREIPVWLEPNDAPPTNPAQYYFSGKNYGLPQFTNDISACFKWLVPNVIDKIMSEQECSSDLAYAILFKKWLQELQLNIPYHALTLCQVISGLIDEKDKTSC